MASRSSRPAYGSRMVERAVARFASGHFERVVGPSARDRVLRSEVLDVDHPADARHLAKVSGCRHGLVPVLHDAGSAYLVFYASRRLSLEVGLVRLDDPERIALWSGAGATARHDGGVPTGPASAALSVWAAGRLASNDDAAVSMLDDALRTAFRSLPDFRAESLGRLAGHRVDLVGN